MALVSCPKCGMPRVGQFRYCPTCAFDFDTIALAVRAEIPPPVPNAGPLVVPVTGVLAPAARSAPAHARRRLDPGIGLISFGVIIGVGYLVLNAAGFIHPATGGGGNRIPAAVAESASPLVTPTPAPTPEPTPNAAARFGDFMTRTNAFSDATVTALKVMIVPAALMSAAGSADAVQLLRDEALAYTDWLDAHQPLDCYRPMWSLGHRSAADIAGGANSLKSVYEDFSNASEAAMNASEAAMSDAMTLITQGREEIGRATALMTTYHCD